MFFCVLEFHSVIFFFYLFVVYIYTFSSQYLYFNCAPRVAGSSLKIELTNGMKKAF